MGVFLRGQGIIGGIYDNWELCIEYTNFRDDQRFWRGGSLLGVRVPMTLFLQLSWKSK